MKTSTSLFAALFSSLLVTVLANPILERQVPVSCDTCTTPGGTPGLWGIFPAASAGNRIVCINYIPFQTATSVPANLIQWGNPCVADSTTQSYASVGYFPTGPLGASNGVIDVTVSFDGQADEWSFEIKVYSNGPSSLQLIGSTPLGKTGLGGNLIPQVVPTTLPEIMNFTAPLSSGQWVVEVLYGSQSIQINPWASAYNPGEIPSSVYTGTFDIPVPSPAPWWYTATE
ncbi:hypothetical protein IMSHALPRED_003808 [Imshaugia aleurites]|uniref:Uncharacterized protein n=1 Tax=Imshaugia aleurites TaxID=172621 RepID=A0A8H3F5G8_9LECA|nr:hypothetical protein IMSHALPRED_003808 [Imshaugia aleurites]